MALLKQTKLKKMVRRGTIPMKIVLIFIGMLLPFYALLVISAGVYIRSIESQAMQSAQSILDINIAQLESEIERIDALYYEMQSNNRDFQRLRSYAGSDQDKLSLFRVNQTLRLQAPMMSMPSALYFYLEDADVLLFHDNAHESSETIALRTQVKASPYIRSAVSWSVATIMDRPWLLHTAQEFGMYYGAMIDLDLIQSKIQSEIPYQKVAVRLTDGQEPTGALRVRGELRRVRKTFVVELDRGEVRESMPEVSRTILVMGFFILLLLPVILIQVLMRMIVRPIRTIEEGMFRIGSGEQNYRIPEFRASREFEGMRNSFNNMASEIETLKIQQYEEQLEKEQMMLQNLLLQIRPHFLLNFFNQIFSMAELRDYQGIQKSSLYLSRYFRYLFCADRVATLRDELALVDAYLELMAERFMDCFTVQRDIDASLLGVRVPPLIVHNFVENIFKYAVDDGNLIDIRLSLRREGGFAVMTISDDGPGMEEEILQKIRAAQPIEKADGTHIGIYNSYYRLRKLCSEDCVLDVQSVLTEGTTVRIMLPDRTGDR